MALVSSWDVLVAHVSAVMGIISLVNMFYLISIHSDYIVYAKASTKINPDVSDVPKTIKALQCKVYDVLYALSR